MPYYDEVFENRAVDTEVITPTSTQRAHLVLESAKLRGHRGRPHPDSVLTTVVDDKVADPYAYFLESTSKKKYRALLKERGLQDDVSPDRGHAFSLAKHTLKGPLFDISRTTAGSTTNYRNAIVMNRPSAGGNLNHVFTDTAPWSPAPYQESDLRNFAQLAYSRSAPTTVQWDAALFLGELREGLPRLIPDLWKGSINQARKAGSDYINVEFGWKPLLSDIINATEALKKATRQLAQQGQRVHRRYVLPETYVTDSRPYLGNASIYMQNSRGFAPTGGGDYATHQTSSEINVTTLYSKARRVRRWFEGEFSHFLPLGFDPDDFLSRANALINIKITPETLWNLAPWSWLVDWNYRIGDSIASNQLASNDNLVMHYGYAMETVDYTSAVSYSVDSATNSSSTVYSGRPSGKVGYLNTTTYKTRLRANPYGFTAGSPGALTGSQSAILGSLGLTKLR